MIAVAVDPPVARDYRLSWIILLLLALLALPLATAEKMRRDCQSAVVTPGGGGNESPGGGAVETPGGRQCWLVFGNIRVPLIGV